VYFAGPACEAAATGAIRTPQKRAAMAQYAEVSNDNISPLFEAAVEATEEAIYNSLFMASTMRSHEVTTNQDVVVERLPLAPFLQGQKQNCR
jgi:D-aminopeptidase